MDTSIMRPRPRQKEPAFLYPHDSTSSSRQTLPPQSLSLHRLCLNSMLCRSIRSGNPRNPHTCHLDWLKVQGRREHRPIRYNEARGMHHKFCRCNKDHRDPPFCTGACHTWYCKTIHHHPCNHRRDHKAVQVQPVNGMKEASKPDNRSVQ